MTTHAIRLQVADAAVTVTSTSRIVTDWTHRYLGTWWTGTDATLDGAHATPNISAEVDAQRYMDVALDVTGGLHENLTYANALTLLAHDKQAGVITAVSPDEALAYRADVAAERLTIYGTNVEPVATATARLAREAMRGVLLRDGWSVLHASAVALDGQVVLTFGPKGAGKTTSAVALAALQGWELLANDRVFVRVNDDGGVDVLPWPSAAALGLGLLDALGWFEIIQERLAGGELLHPTQDQRVTDALIDGRREPLWNGKRELKAQIFPDQFPGWFDLELAKGGQAAALLFPSVQPGATARLVDGGRTLGDGDFMSGKTEDRYPDIFELARVDGGGTAEARQRVTKLLAGLPRYAAVLGHDLAANADCLAKLIVR
jgi:hypothetical protein